jgi:hypothetical protein
MPDWTTEETELAEQLIKRNAKNDEFLAAVGRSKLVAKQRIDRIRFRDGIDKRPIAPKMKIPAEVIDDRNRRLMARLEMSLTGLLMGDPPEKRA